MGEAPAGAASTLNCKMPVARVMWTSTVRFRVRVGVRVRVRVRVRLGVVLQYFLVDSVWTMWTLRSGLSLT